MIKKIKDRNEKKEKRLLIIFLIHKYLTKKT